MSGNTRHWLWRHLWGWAMAALALVWGSLVAVSYTTGLHEAREITDGQLHAAARLLLHAPPGAGSTPEPGPGGDYAPELRVLRWQGEALVWDSHRMAAHLPGPLRVGLQNMTATDGSRWRVLQLADAASGARVAVMMTTDHRLDLGADIAEHIVLPALIVLPLVALLLAWAMRRGLRPLEQLSGEIRALDTDAGQTLQEQHRFTELATTVEAINRLVRQLQGQLERERDFTADVAHELRTPLTAIVWQTRLASETGDDGERAAALHQAGQDALRAGHILGQLTELARARALDPRALQRLDVPALAADLVAQFAPAAHASGHELSLRAGADAALHAWPGQRGMLELALRNLIDNALRHTPRGTQVEVALGQDAQGPWLAVHDDGRRDLPDDQAAAVAGGGLGLGLRLTERLARWQGLRLARETAPAPFTTRFVLRWPAA